MDGPAASAGQTFALTVQEHNTGALSSGDAPVDNAQHCW